MGAPLSGGAEQPEVLGTCSTGATVGTGAAVLGGGGGSDGAVGLAPVGSAVAGLPESETVAVSEIGLAVAPGASPGGPPSSFNKKASTTPREVCPKNDPTVLPAT